MTALTAVQRTRGFALLDVLVAQSLDPKAAAAYNHTDFLTCSVGSAIRSKRFRTIPVHVISQWNGTTRVATRGDDSYTAERIFDELTKFFGEAVVEGVMVYSSGVRAAGHHGEAQLQRAIELLSAALGLTLAPVEVEKAVDVDTTRDKLKARIAELEQVQDAVDEIPESQRARFVNADELAKVNTEIEILQSVLEA